MKYILVISGEHLNGKGNKQCNKKKSGKLKCKVWNKNIDVNSFTLQIFIDYVKLDAGNTMMN